MPITAVALAPAIIHGAFYLSACAALIAAAHIITQLTKDTAKTRHDEIVNRINIDNLREAVKDYNATNPDKPFSWRPIVENMNKKQLQSRAVALSDKSSALKKQIGDEKKKLDDAKRQGASSPQIEYIENNIKDTEEAVKKDDQDLADIKKALEPQDYTVYYILFGSALVLGCCSCVLFVLYRKNCSMAAKLKRSEDQMDLGIDLENMSLLHQAEKNVTKRTGRSLNAQDRTDLLNEANQYTRSFIEEV